MPWKNYKLIGLKEFHVFKESHTYICGGMNLSNESKVGIFAAVGIAVFIIGYNYMKGKDLFSSTNSYYAVFETVDGLVASNPVMINGHRIGQVREVKLQKGEGYSLMVKIDVTGDIEVPKNSTIKVYSADFFGSKAVELVLGDENEMANAEREDCQHPIWLRQHF